MQLLLIAAFLLVGFGVQRIRRAEQTAWVGMAKETAHQLGTPLSSLMAWSSLLSARARTPGAVGNGQRHRPPSGGGRAVLQDWLRADLTTADPLQVVEETVNYMRPRISKNVKLSLESGESHGELALSRPLFSWVLENLLRNAVDAMEGEGTLVVRAAREGDEVHIEVEDNGKGMTKTVARRVFDPGFTTKSRGWGLGLSLSKRIVEETHGGQVFVDWTSPAKAPDSNSCFEPGLNGPKHAAVLHVTGPNPI